MKQHKPLRFEAEFTPVKIAKCRALGCEGIGDTINNDGICRHCNEIGYLQNGDFRKKSLKREVGGTVRNEGWANFNVAPRSTPVPSLRKHRYS